MRGRESHRLYSFDMVFDIDTKQETLFESAIKPIICDVLSGYNCTVFAYGQTGSGKTYTMEGDRFFVTENGSCPIHGNENDGIIPRAIELIFESLRAKKMESSVSVSHLEIYNEELRDLLSTEESAKKLILLKNDSTKNSSRKNTCGLYVRGLEEIIVKSPQDIYNILSKSSQRRCVASTYLNERSSRSHCIFTVVIRTRETLETEDLVKTGTLNLVDLAGSESVGRSGAIDQRAIEAGHINTSLLTLGRVISALVDRQKHVPYRISVYVFYIETNLLIATISPESSLDESLSTLDYALRAKNIQNKPEINASMTQKSYVKELQITVNNYKKQIEALRNEKGIILPADQFQSMELTINTQKIEIDKLTTMIDHEKKEVLRITSLFQKQTSELGQLQIAKSQLQVLLRKISKTCKYKQHKTFLTTELQELTKTLNEVREELECHKLVIGAYENTEKELRSQAEDLKKVLESTLHDRALLLEKMGYCTFFFLLFYLLSAYLHAVSNTDQQKQLENQNVEQLSGGKNQLAIFWNQTKQQLDEFNSVQNDYIKDMSASIDKLQTQCQYLFLCVEKALKDATDSMAIICDKNVMTPLKKLSGTTDEWMQNYHLKNLGSVEKLIGKIKFQHLENSEKMKLKIMPQLFSKISQQMTEIQTQVYK
ncbi:hypothetical protein RFI_20360 [Reticulomyxa filosa]|uniref:Kinesin-like protein n=1 Tax=Reticulomyxa filosa TaxID=46433 RepID=X6MU68_RETFI|nr:hypothetical protein RFI_20360 [Reticulomyxa filosa]|eukprot:ETO16977.1 hypothetical protein RFI_20360 [Reticulomyxa filosa]